MTTAVEVWGRHVRQIRTLFAARVDALYEQWLASHMEITERDRRMAVLRTEEEHCVELERDLYRLNASTERRAKEGE